jgi:hypothetical protein
VQERSKIKRLVALLKAARDQELFGVAADYQKERVNGIMGLTAKEMQRVEILIVRQLKLTVFSILSKIAKNFY